MARTKPKWGYKNSYFTGITGNDTPEIEDIIKEWDKNQGKALKKIADKELPFKDAILKEGQLPEEAYAKIKKTIARYFLARTHHEKAPNKAEIEKALEILSKDAAVLLEHLVGLDDVTRDVILSAAVDLKAIKHGEKVLEVLNQTKNNLIDLSRYLSKAQNYCKRDFAHYRKSNQQDRLDLAKGISAILKSYGVPCTQTPDGPLCSILGHIFQLVDGRPHITGRDIQAIAKAALK
jgi:hypothetical protein